MTMSWDIFIAFGVLLSVLYGFILQRNKIVLVLINVYIALAVVNAIGPSFNNLMQKMGMLLFTGTIAGKFFSLFITQTFLFISLIMLLTLRAEHAKALSDVKVTHPAILSFVYSVLFALIVTTTVVSFLSPEMRTSIMDQSAVIAWLMVRHVWWVVLPVIVMLVTSYFIVADE